MYRVIPFNEAIAYNTNSRLAQLAHVEKIILLAKTYCQPYGTPYGMSSLQLQAL